MILRLIARRLLWALPVLWVVATLTFTIIKIVPGGPFDADKHLPPEIIANINAKYNLDKPVIEQYFLYLNRLAHGDLGVSYKYESRTVNDILAKAAPVSFELGLTALFLAVCMGLLLGTIAALYRQTYIDYLAMTLATMGISVPAFLIGALLILIFGLWLKIMPVALWESPVHIILPAITLSLMPAAYIARLTRASVLDSLHKDWVRTAYSKGLSARVTIVKHVLRNSLMPIVTILGPLTAILITGSFTVEYIFAIPGMGRFFITAAINRDYDLIMATSLIFAIVLIIANLIVDIVYTMLDPQIQLKD